MLGYNLVMLDYILVTLDYKLVTSVNILVTLGSIHHHLEHRMVTLATGAHNQVTAVRTCYRLLVTAYMVNLVTYRHLVTLANELVNIPVRNSMQEIGMVKMQHCQVSLQIHVMV